MPVETRYMRSDQHTVNDLTAYKLGTEQSSTSATECIGLYDGNTYCTHYLGIRIWKRAEDGTETEITAGTAVAIASGYDTGLISASWNCPLASLNPTDAIVVRVYSGTSSPPTHLEVTFITEQLGASQLDASTWTVYYYLRRTYNFFFDQTIYDFIYGTSTYNSRIEGFSWSTAPPPVVKQPVMDGFVFVE